MVSLLLTVFLIQVFIYLVNSIGAKTINDLLWQLSARLPLSSSRDAKEQIQLRREVVRLKREMTAISAQDDFAKWAKIRREHDKVLAAHDKKASDVSAHRGSFDTKASVVRWLCTTGLRFGMQFWHAKTPIYTYPRGWFPWPVEWVLAFPRCASGGVSINIWTMACGTVIALVGDLSIYAVQYIQGTEPVKQKVGAQPEKMKMKI